MLAALKVRVGVSAVRGLAARGVEVAVRPLAIAATASNANGKIQRENDSNIINKLLRRFIGENTTIVNGKKLTHPRQLYGNATGSLIQGVKGRNVGNVIAALKSTHPLREKIDEQAKKEIREMLGLKK